jgi:glycosyltransferase involved in cell wall biosynthesis
VLLTVPHLKTTASPHHAIMAIARYLPRDEFRLTICSLRLDGYEETAPVLEGLGIPVFVARFRPRGRRPRHVLASLKDQRVIAKRGPFDVQHSLDFTPSFLEALMARAAGRRFVFSQRNMNPRGSRLSLKLKIRLAHRIVANSEAVRRFLIGEGAAAQIVSTVHVGVEGPSSPSSDGQIPPLRHCILSVGQIKPLKRHEDAIRALALLSPEMPQLRLLIPGPVMEEGYRKELEDLARDLGLSERVELMGMRQDVPRLMREADCLVLCSEREAFANVIVEAMAAGLPVVASAVDGSKEAVKDGESGYLVPVGDVEGYARALRTILNDADLRRRMAETGRRLVSEKYSAPRMGEQIADVYRRAAG